VRRGKGRRLEWLRQAGDKFEMPVITEIRGESQVDVRAEYVDILQIGARICYDQDLIGKSGQKGKPILYKRHFGAGIQEFLSFCEYIAAEGNKDIILCERGIIPVGRAKNYTRYTSIYNAVPAIQKRDLFTRNGRAPVMAPDDATLSFSMSCAAIAAGACGLMIEVHYIQQRHGTHAQQQITPPDELKETIDCL